MLEYPIFNRLINAFRASDHKRGDLYNPSERTMPFIPTARTHYRSQSYRKTSKIYGKFYSPNKTHSQPKPFYASSRVNLSNAQLTHLYADCNQLSTLPNNFNRLTTLVEINLRKNQFTNIPEVLFLFSFNLVACFRMNPIPVVTARSLRQRISHPDYKGPQIHFLVNRFAKIP